METKTWFIIYAAVTFVFHAISLLFLWKKFKKKMDNPQFQMVKNMVFSIKSAQALKEKIWNPYTMVFVVLLLAVISPFIFPLTIISILKKLIFGKSKLEKEAEAESKAMDESRKRSEEFMRTEGMGAVEKVDIDMKIDLNIDKNIDDINHQL